VLASRFGHGKAAHDSVNDALNWNRFHGGQERGETEGKTEGETRGLLRATVCAARFERTAYRCDSKKSLAAASQALSRC
jgi:hypothetical protein